MYTCNTCSLQFPTPDDQRAHMKSDWHRYNLKRRVANLPSIEEALFNEKVAKLSITEEVNDDETKYNKKSAKQITKKEQRRREKEELLEKKKALLEIAKQNMINSLKNEGKIEIKETPEPIQEKEPEVEEIKEPITEDQKEEQKEEIPEDQLTEEQLLAKIMEEKIKNKTEIPPEFCLFCHKKFPNFEVCCTHMFKYHGFYIPEQKYLTDKLGLVSYMAEKIGVGNLCVVCDYQGRSIEAVRAHMLSKQHCRIPYESEVEKLEISEFYDFSETYNWNKANEENDEDWEDEEIVEDDDESDDGSEPQEDLPQQISYDDGVELHLPSGVKVGHRSLARYFRQNLRPESVLSEGQGTVIAAESRHLISVADRAVLMEKKRTWRSEKKSEDRNDRRAQKFINNQPHYRDQLLQ